MLTFGFENINNNWNWKQDYIDYDNQLGAWHLNPIKNINDIQNLTIIRNNKKIVTYDFNKIDKNRFKSLNRHESK